jgi:hypothetical protein
MAETVSAVVSEIRTQGSLDLSDAEALAILNRRHKQMNARAGVYRDSQAATRLVDVGAAVTFSAPAGLQQLLQLLNPSYVSVGRARRSDIAEMIAGTLPISGAGSVYAEYGEGSAGVATTVWLIYPDPVAVTAYGIYETPDLLLDNSVPFVVDADLIEGLMAGVFATALQRPGEARPDLAAQQEQLFSAACEEQRARAARRYRGSGPAQIRLSGNLAR